MKRIRFASGFLKAILHNKCLIVLFFLFLVFFTCGCFLAKNADAATVDFIKGVVTNFVLTRTATPFLMVLLNSFLASAGFLLLFFTIGLCAAGPLLSPLVLVFKGVGYGTLVGFLYAQYELKGIAFTAIIVLLPALVFTTIYIFASREAFGFSTLIFKQLLSNRGSADLNPAFRLYCARFVFMLLVCFVGALLDAILTSAFIRFFSF